MGSEHCWEGATARTSVMVLGLVVVVVTAVRGVQQHAGVPLAAHVAVGIIRPVRPSVDAALARARDSYAAEGGTSAHLAAALQIVGHMGDGDGGVRRSHHSYPGRICCVTSLDF